jgi:phosphate transport system protein
MSHFDEEISALKDKLLGMASRSESAVTRAIRALVERDDDLARLVQEDDDAVDRLEIEVDEDAIRLLAKAPLASQLRLIICASKIARDLERIGDEATTIARRAVELNAEPQLKPYWTSPAWPRWRPKCFAMRSEPSPRATPSGPVR